MSHVPNPVDGELFAPSASEQARVCWFPKKRPREASLLKRLLAGDPRLSGVDLVELVQAPRAEVAATLASSAVFVALGHTESFGLPVAEALAAGCLVVGYDGGGGHELFEAPGAWRIPDQRPLLLRDRVAALMQELNTLTPVRAANRRWVLDRYPFARTGARWRKRLPAHGNGPGRRPWPCIRWHGSTPSARTSRPSPDPSVCALHDVDELLAGEIPVHLSIDQREGTGAGLADGPGRMRGDDQVRG